MNEQEILIKEQLSKLPNPLRKALEIVSWEEILRSIALSNKLNLSQISLLKQETMLILYGFDDPKNYIDNLVREVGLDETFAITIAEAVGEQILKPISQKAQLFAKAGVAGNLPMVEKGEVAHSVPHVETPTQSASPVPSAPSASAPSPTADTKMRPSSDKPKPAVTTPDYRYPGSADPYREPLA